MLDDRGALRAVRAAAPGPDRRADQQAQRRVEVEEVVVRELLAPELLGQRVPVAQVERGARLRVLAVAQRLRERDGQREGAGQLVRDQPGLEIARDRRVVFGGPFERARREAPPRGAVDAGRERFDQLAVLLGVDEHGDVLEILRGRADERDAADVDLLDRFLQRRARLRDRLLERVEVDDDGRDRRDAVFLRLGQVSGVAAIGEDPAEDARVQRLHAAVEERREAGQIADVERLDAVLDQVRARPAGRVDRQPRSRERAGELDHTATLVDREQRRGLSVNGQGPSPAAGPLRRGARRARPR